MNRSATALSDLPEALCSVRTRALFLLRVEVRKPLMVGATPGAFRRIGGIPGGSFEGERLAGQVLDSGSDWQTIRSDGAVTLDVRLVLRTTDDALISMRYPGVRHGPAEVLARLDKGEVVDPASYYLRIAPIFETAAPQYDWLNRVLAVGLGQRLANEVIYHVFEVL